MPKEGFKVRHRLDPLLSGKLFEGECGLGFQSRRFRGLLLHILSITVHPEISTH